MLMNKLGREITCGCYMHDHIQLSSSDTSEKASRNTGELYEGSNTSTNYIPMVKVVDTNLVEYLQTNLVGK